MRIMERLSIFISTCLISLVPLILLLFAVGLNALHGVFFLTLVAVLLHVHREIERVSRQEKSTLFSDIGPRGVASAALMAPIVTVTGWMIASLAVFAVSSVISPDVAVRAAIASVFVCFPIAMTKSRKIRGALLVMAVSYGAFFVGVISGNWW